MYRNLAQLADAYKRGEISEPLTLDNDSTSVYIYQDGNDECVFEMHPDEVLLQALTLLGVPHEHV